MSAALDLVLAPDPESFVRAAREWIAAPERLEEAVPTLVRETALRHYRPRYPKHVPHAVFSLLGGLEARDLLAGPERAWPVLKALSYVFRERHLDPFPVEDHVPGGDERSLAAALEAGSFPEAYAATLAVLDGPDGPARARNALLSFGITDCFNLCHRVIYPAKALHRLEAEPGLDAAVLIFPAVHYLCRASRDGGYWKLLAGADARVDGDAPLDPATAATIERAAASGNLTGTRDAVRTALRSGIGGRAVTEEIFAAAVRRLATASDLDWVTFVHVANCAEAVREWLDRGDADGRAVLTAAVFLADAASRSAPVDAPRREPRSGPELERELILTGCRIGGEHAFGHDLKLVANAIRMVRNGSAPGLATTLADAAAFLDRFPADGPVMSALLPSG